MFLEEIRKNITICHLKIVVHRSVKINDMPHTMMPVFVRNMEGSGSAIIK